MYAALRHTIALSSNQNGLNSFSARDIRDAKYFRLHTERRWPVGPTFISSPSIGNKDRALCCDDRLKKQEAVARDP